MDNNALLIMADFLDETNHQGQAFARIIRESIEPPQFSEEEIYGFIVKGVDDNLIVYDQNAHCEVFTKRLIYLMKNQAKYNYPHRSLEHIILPYIGYMDFYTSTCLQTSHRDILEPDFIKCFNVNLIPTFVPMFDYFTNLKAFVHQYDTQLCVGICNDRHVVLGSY